jgi:hypothetical protein
VPKTSSLKVGVAVATVVVAVILVIAVGVVAHGHHDRGVARSARSAATRSPVPRELASAYRFLTSASTPRRPHGVVRVRGVPGGKVVVSAGTEVGKIAHERVWMVLGHSQSCIEVDDGGGACGPNWLVARHGVFVMLVPVSGAAPTVYGIVPDGAKVTGRAAAVTQSGNAYMVRPTSHHPGRFAVHTAHGPTITTMIPPATGHPQ